MPFVIRKFDYTESLGEKLKVIRHASGRTLSEMADKTKIRKAFLQAFEEGNYAKLPDPVYARNFLKIYVRALGGDEEYFLQQFETECGTCDFMFNARLPRSRTRAIQFLVASKFIQIFIISSIGLGIVGYFGYQIREILSPPELLVYEPSDGILTSDALITVTGQAGEDARVTVNGIPVLLSTDGAFEFDVALERGLNVIAIESTKRYSHPATQYRRVVLQQDRTLSMSP
ncbi:helix-turn-helix domain-containing protein [Candidatus Uhrbacteria bacterium]|nr:helix-turn-helix domain-containing protein [Candidatus Uhrbacteria bacterium]